MAAQEGLSVRGGRTDGPGAGAQRWASEMLGRSRAAPARCWAPWEGLGQRRCSTGDRQGKDRGQLRSCFFNKTTHFLAFLPMRRAPDPEPSPPCISYNPHLTLQTHRNPGFLNHRFSFRWRFDSNLRERMTNPTSKEGEHGDHVLLGDALHDPGCSVQPSHAGGQGRDVQP